MSLWLNCVHLLFKLFHITFSGNLSYQLVCSAVLEACYLIVYLCTYTHNKAQKGILHLSFWYATLSSQCQSICLLYQNQKSFNVPQTGKFVCHSSDRIFQKQKHITRTTTFLLEYTKPFFPSFPLSMYFVCLIVRVHSFIWATDKDVLLRCAAEILQHNACCLWQLWESHRSLHYLAHKQCHV